MIEINYDILEKLKAFYKDSFPKHWNDEKYKWMAVKCFQDNWDINAPNFAEMIERSMKKTGNLLASRNSFPLAMLLKFANASPADTKNLFINLYNENLDLEGRVNSFINDSEAIRKKYDDGTWKNHYQWTNAISTYLWLRYPDKYYIFKYSEVRPLAKLLTKNSPIKRGEGPKNMAIANQILDVISTELIRDTDCKQMLTSSLTTDCYPDPEMKTMAIDFEFHISRYYSDSQNTQKQQKYWLYAPGEKARFWDEFYKKGIMAIGWEKLEDLSKYYKREEITDAMNINYGTDSSHINDSLCVWQFTNEININDIVFVKQGKSKILGYGIVTSNYYFDDNRGEYPNVRTVEWKAKGVWVHPSGDSVLKTLTDITPYTEYVEKLKALFDMKTSLTKYTDLLRSTHNLILSGAPGTGKTYLARQIAKEMGCSDNEIGFVQFHPSYDYTDFVEGLRPIQDDNGNVGFERKDGVFKAFCKKTLSVPKNDTIDNFDETWDKLVTELNENNFIDVPFLSNKSKNFRVELNEYGTGLANRTYPNDTYEQGGWISGQSKFFSKDQLYNIYRGLSGVPSGGHDNYRRAIVEEMKKDFGLKPYKEGNSETKSDKVFVFIIDEINRGEISKIFGELFFSIDPGYRGEKGRVQTQYQNIVEDGDIFKKGFFVPENVYIIGTMNDIDRSVESMDFAFRRRFAFKEIKADENVGMLDKLDQKDEAINRMKNLNAAIEKIDGLSSAYHIGASYFLKLNDYNGDFDKLWEYHLEGLLREYLRGTQNVDNEIEKLKTAYNDESDHNNGQPQQAN